jgi:hypothetical protein
VQSAEQTHDAAVASEILVLGDSLAKFGIQPRVIETRTGRSSYNLAIGGGSAVATHYLLERALQAGARPSAIVVDYFHKQLSEDPRVALRGHPEMLELRQCLDLAWTTRDPIFLASIMTDRLIPSSRYRRQIRDSFQTALAGKTPPGRGQVPIWVRNMRANRGAIVVLNNSEPQWENGPERTFIPQLPDQNPLNATYLRRTMRLAADRRIPVFWVIPPLAMKAHSPEEGLLIDACYRKLVREIQGEFPTVTVLDASHSGYPKNAYFDLVHLGGQGSLCLSTDVADAVRHSTVADASRSRWIELPAYRELIPPGSFEGLDESRAALRAAAGRVRR